MVKKEKYRVHDWVKFSYSEIGEYIDENHTDRPLRNDEIVDLLNTLNDENEQLRNQLSQLAQNNREGVKKVQQLADENKQLKMGINSLKLLVQNWEALDEEKDEQLDKQNQALKKLKKENEQLKQFQDRVFCWIDMHLQRLPTLRDNEFESDNEFADPSKYQGAIDILETMKKELSE